VSTATKRFVRHYVEMVVAMVLGMAVLSLPAEWALGAFGSSWSDLHHNAPALMLLVMAFMMTVPMVGWMAYRGHGRRPNSEMAASMFLPTFGVIGLLWGGVVTDAMALMTIEHIVMLPSMLAAMLLRRAEYSGYCQTRVELGVAS
jgi:flagellar biosynthetic protein FliP